MYGASWPCAVWVVARDVAFVVALVAPLVVAPVVALVVRTGRNCRPGSLLEASVGTRVGAFALGPSYRLWVTPTHSWAKGEKF